ncbi:hypothetical protein ACHAWF_015896 [Thalassiosira exigua]
MNIDTDHATGVISSRLDSLELPDGFPLDVVKEAMKLAVQNNVFKWGDCFFLQLLDTAMGTSAACMWNAIYFAVHELDCLLPTYSYHLLSPYAQGLLPSHTQQLLYFIRFFDDIFGIWLHYGSSHIWNRFKHATLCHFPSNICW